MRWRDQLTKDIGARDMSWSVAALRGSLVTSLYLIIVVLLMLLHMPGPITWTIMRRLVVLVGAVALPGAIGGIVYRAVAVVGIGYYFRWAVAATAAMVVVIIELSRMGAANEPRDPATLGLALLVGTPTGDVLLCVFAVIGSVWMARYFKDWWT